MDNSNFGLGNYLMAGNNVKSTDFDQMGGLDEPNVKLSQQ